MTGCHKGGGALRPPKDAHADQSEAHHSAPVARCFRLPEVVHTAGVIGAFHLAPTHLASPIKIDRTPAARRLRPCSNLRGIFDVVVREWVLYRVIIH